MKRRNLFVPEQEINFPDGLMLLNGLAAKVREPLERELRDDEKVLWCGQPGTRHYRQLGFGWLIFGIIWLGFWVVFGFLTRNNSVLLGWAVVFAVPGVVMLSGPFWARTLARETAYVLTTRRVVIVQLSIFSSKNVLSFGPNRLALIEREERADGSGDLIFEKFEERIGSGSNTVRHGFFAIERVREVEDLIVGSLLEGKRDRG